MQLDPLRGEIDITKSNYTVGKVKVEVRFVKDAAMIMRWGGLVGDAPDRECASATTPRSLSVIEANTPAPPIALNAFPTTTTSIPAASARNHKPFYKNWDGITSEILADDKQVSTSEDPNAGGDAAVNKFFQEIYGNADENTKRAMMKSFVESGGTTLSTNWEEVGKGEVSVKPPQGSEWKKWGE